MSYGTSDSTVISPIKPEAHNLDTTIASAASHDGSSPETVHAHTIEDHQEVLIGFSLNRVGNHYIYL